MTGCRRNGSWPSRGQDNNLPAIYFSSSFSDRKKPTKNTPYIFMMCVVTLRSHTDQPPACRRVNTEFRPGYSSLCPIRKTPELEMLQPVYAACSNACFSSLWKDFSLCQAGTMYVLQPWILQCQVYVELFHCFSSGKILPVDAVLRPCSEVCGPCCCLYQGVAVPEFNLLGKLLPLLLAEI